jgi:ABC-2 type transport system ATP-binding protein/sodium transport system ATP-binding protein
MISACQLAKRFPLAGGGELAAVDGVSFAVETGEVYGLLGPNGAGKTTTLRMLLGLLAPSAGYAAIAGFRSDEAPDEVKRRVGLVAASTGVYPWLTVRETLLFFGDLYGLAPEAAAASAEQLAALFGLNELLDRRAATLSTGQKQRMNLARALIHDPPVVLMDEPTLGLDVLGAQVVLEYVAHLRGRGKAVIVTTHHLDEAERYCTRFGLMHAGRLVAEGTLAELRSGTGCATLVEMFLRLSRIGPALAAAPPGTA